MKRVSSTVFRYFILLVIGLEYLIRGYDSIFYIIPTRLTAYLSLFPLKLFYTASLVDTTIVLQSLNIALVPACIGGAAYFLLVSLNLTTPMQSSNRIKSLLLIISSFLILNTLRIVIFSIIAVNSINLFDISHMLFWYMGSTLLVIIIWFSSNYILKIKSIPAYTDIKNIIT